MIWLWIARNWQAGLCVVLVIACGVLYTLRASAIADASRQAEKWANERATLERIAREASERYRTLEREAVDAMQVLAQNRAKEVSENEASRRDLRTDWPTFRMRKSSDAAAASGGDVPQVRGAEGSNDVACEDRLRRASEAAQAVIAAARRVSDDARPLADSAVDAQNLLAQFRETRGAVLACERVTQGGRE